jgi:hypothetical protein
VERALRALRALPRAELEHQRARAEHCFAALLAGAGGDCHLLQRVLREQVGLDAMGADEVIERARVRLGRAPLETALPDGGDAADADADAEAGDGKPFVDPPSRGVLGGVGVGVGDAAAAIKPRAVLLAFFACPLLALLIYTAACLGYADRELQVRAAQSSEAARALHDPHPSFPPLFSALI